MGRQKHVLKAIETDKWKGGALQFQTEQMREHHGLTAQMYVD
jgi:hypothetical protein